MPNCIYCLTREADSREHYVPQALGRFENIDPLKDAICRACNNRLGDTVDIAWRNASPEALLRMTLPLKPSRRNRSTRLPQPFEATRDSVPMSIHATLPGSNLPAQFSLQRADDGKFVLHFGSGDAERIQRFAHELGWELAPATDPTGTIEVPALEWPAEPYGRAIAKIGFHYALQFAPGIDGHDASFEEIREYIDKGQAPAVIPLKLTEWRFDTPLAHVVGVLKTGSENLTAFVQRFAGHDNARNTTLIRLQKHFSPLDNAGLVSMHHFALRDDPQGFVGAKITQYRESPTPTPPPHSRSPHAASPPTSSPAPRRAYPSFRTPSACSAPPPPVSLGRPMDFLESTPDFPRGKESRVCPSLPSSRFDSERKF